ncbi:MAG: RepB family DNA primase [Acidobacteria bacterium]|nr:RepB family DNA primase [Acidobacteriota bacterium]
MDKTTQAVYGQINAMGCDVFELGLFNPANVAVPMIPRTWDKETLLRSVSWLRYQNREGRNIYARPHGEHNLTLIDDLKPDAIKRMNVGGFHPSVGVETSPGNYQAWVKHPRQLSKELGTVAARMLADKFGGDHGSADWRHFGRVSGFCNRKGKYKDPETGLFPFVLLHEATGQIYPEGERFLVTVQKAAEEQRKQRDQIRQRMTTRPVSTGELKKTIEDFRRDLRYGGSETRQDLAYAIYALSHGAGEAVVAAALRSRDLSHKGSERRQDDYVTRTIRKALEGIGGRGH